MSRLPIVGGDDGDWGTILNDYLEVQHSNAAGLEGTHKAITVPDLSATTDDAFKAKLTADTQYQFIINADGALEWGPGGTTAPDTNLYRSAANTLKSDDSLEITGSAGIGGAIGTTEVKRLKVWGEQGIEAEATAGSGNALFFAKSPSSNTTLPNRFLAATRIGTGNSTTALSGYIGTDSQIYWDTTNAGYNFLVTTVPRLTINTAGLVSIPTTGSSAGLSIGGDTNLYRSAADTLKTDDTLVAADVKGGLETAAFSNTGTLVATTGTHRYYLDNAYTIVEVRASVGTAPTGASIIVDVNKNGTTIFTTQGNRPTIAASGFTDGSNVPDVTSLADGDYLTVDIDQVGSTIAGADLTVQVLLRRA